MMRRVYGITTNSQNGPTNSCAQFLYVSANTKKNKITSSSYNPSQKNTCSRWYAYKTTFMRIVLWCSVVRAIFRKNLTPLAQARVSPFEELFYVIRLYQKNNDAACIHKVIKSSNHIHPFTPHVSLTYNIQCDVASLRLRSYKTHQRRHYVRDMVIISYYFCWKILRSRVIIKATSYIVLFTLKIYSI